MTAPIHATWRDATPVGAHHVDLTFATKDGPLVIRIGGAEVELMSRGVAEKRKAARFATAADCPHANLPPGSA